jgi:hypothetical protein
MKAYPKSNPRLNHELTTPPGLWIKSSEPRPSQDEIEIPPRTMLKTCKQGMTTF